MELTLQRGAIPVDLDIPRTLIFDMRATWLLIQRYGSQFLTALYVAKSLPGGKSWVELKDMEVLQYFLWAGLQADARQRGEEFTMDMAAEQLRPFTYTKIFNAVVVALMADTTTPVQPGKTPATGTAAKPAAKAKPTPGPTKVSTSLKRSASPTRSSAGPRRSSGR